MTDRPVCPKCGSDMSLWCDKDIKERNFDEVKNLREQIKAKDKLLTKAAQYIRRGPDTDNGLAFDIEQILEDKV